MKVLDTVVLERDFPKFGLRQGDLGVIVEIYGANGLEVEFLAGSGRTQALVTLKRTDIRPMTDTDILAVRSLYAA